MAENKRTFYAPDVDINHLAQSLNDWLARQSYETQIFPSASGGVTVQARKENTWRQLTGMSSALTIVINFEGEGIGIEMGGAKWIDKGVAAGVGALIFWPTLVTAGVGAYQQTQLQNQTWKFIEEYLRGNSAAYASGAVGGSSFAMPQSVPSPMPGHPPVGSGAVPPPINMSPGMAGMANSTASTSNCSQCGQPLRQGAKFCDNCGAPASNICRSCGKALRAGAKFCDECGAPIN